MTQKHVRQCQVAIALVGVKNEGLEKEKKTQIVPKTSNKRSSVGRREGVDVLQCKVIEMLMTTSCGKMLYICVCV